MALHQMTFTFNRLGDYDFAALNFRKSPIGSTVKNGLIIERQAAAKSGFAKVGMQLVTEMLDLARSPRINARSRALSSGGISQFVSLHRISSIDTFRLERANALATHRPSSAFPLESQIGDRQTTPIGNDRLRFLNRSSSWRITEKTASRLAGYNSAPGSFPFGSTSRIFACESQRYWPDSQARSHPCRPSRTPRLPS